MNELPVTCMSISERTICIATKSFFRIYLIRNLKEIALLHESHVKDVFLIDSIPSAQKVVYVSAENKQQMRILSYMPNSNLEIEFVTYESNILNVKASEPVIIVALKNNTLSIIMHANLKMSCLLTSKANPFGIIGVSSNLFSNQHLAYPHSPGKVALFNLIERKSLGTILSQGQETITAIAMAPTKAMLATVGEKGTYISVHDINGDELYGFRRGHSQATIQSLTFNESATFLTCTSTKNTVHVFNVSDVKSEPKVSQKGAVNQVPEWSGYLNTVGDYLSNKLSFLEGERAFSWINMDRPNSMKTISSLIELEDKRHHIILVSENGMLQRFSMDHKTKGKAIYEGNFNLLIKKSHNYPPRRRSTSSSSQNHNVPSEQEQPYSNYLDSTQSTNLNTQVREPNIVTSTPLPSSRRKKSTASTNTNTEVREPQFETVLSRRQSTPIDIPGGSRRNYSPPRINPRPRKYSRPCRLEQESGSDD